MCTEKNQSSILICLIGCPDFCWLITNWQILQSSSILIISSSLTMKENMDMRKGKGA